MAVHQDALPKRGMRRMIVDRRPTMRLNKKTIIAAATAIFAVAASLGSTILTPEQREAVLQILAVVL